MLKAIVVEPEPGEHLIPIVLAASKGGERAQKCKDTESSHDLLANFIDYSIAKVQRGKIIFVPRFVFKISINCRCKYLCR